MAVMIGPPEVVSSPPTPSKTAMTQRNLLILGATLTCLLAGLLLFWQVGGDGEVDHDSEPPAESAALSGRVIDTSGRAVPRANIFAGASHSQADQDGTFSFAELPAEELPVDVTVNGYKRAGMGSLGRPVFDLSDGEPLTGVELVIGRAASISGQVLAGGIPVEGAKINLNYLFADGLDGLPLEPHIVSQVALSDDGGHFEIAELAPGRLQVLVEADDHPFTESREMYLRPGRQIDDLIIDIAPAGVVAGQVLSEWGEALAAELTLTPLSSGTRATTIRTGDDGEFFFDRLEAGNYRLEATAPDFRPEIIERFHVGGEGVSRLEIVLEQRRGYYGRVIEADGEPVEGALVTFETGDQRRVQRLRTDQNGRFEWNDEDRGVQLWVYADSPGHQASERHRARADEEIVLEVERGGRVIGRVVDPDGQPVTDYNLGVSFVEFDDDARYNTTQMPRGAVSDGRGYFELGPLRSGRYRLMVEADDFPPARTEALRVTPGETVGPITIRMEASSTLSGVVLDADTGEPVADAQVIFSINTPSNRQPRTYADEQGRYEITDLPSGRASVRVVHDMYIFEHFGGIDLPPGGEATVDFEIEPIGDGQPGQSVQGIGAALSRSGDGYEIQRLFDDSPAARAGLAEGDIITAVGEQSVQQMTMDQVVEQIRGVPGTSVQLRVQRSGRGTRTVEVQRDRVFMAQDRVVRGRLE